MPELPEVQTIVNDLINANLPGEKIQAVTISWPRSIAGMTAKKFARQLRGAVIQLIRRRAKYIIFELDQNRSLVLHLRMSGRLRLADSTTKPDTHEHVCLTLSGGRDLRLHDTRKFARWSLCTSADELLGNLGPEPLSPAFTLRLLSTLLNRKRMLKPLLLDQRIIAGLGNIYVDEALWEAGLHPCRRAAALSEGERKKLFRAIPLVLKRGLANMGTTLGTGEANFLSIAGRQGTNRQQLRVFRRTGQPCPRCGAAIERIIVGQRSTHICPDCQPGSEPYA
jgi:formamidopyrimidine-DNA glycosylase